MKLSRRFFVAGVLAAPAGLNLAQAMPALAQESPSGSTPEVARVVAVQNFQFGDHVVTALSDGYTDLDAAMLAGIMVDEAAALLEADFAGAFPTAAGLNAYLVRGQGETVLVDAGGAADLIPTAGGLIASLEAVGVPPAEIDLVLLTHLHPDHIGALLSGSEPAFPNAVVRVHQAEIDFWRNDEAMSAAGEAGAVYFAAARAVLDVYGDRVEPFDGNDPVAVGITARELPGHTPGHSGFMIGGNEDGLLICGDIVHIAPVQVARPEVAMVFDVDGDQAIATRRALFEEAAATRLRIAGMHIPFPGIGHLVAQDEGAYRFVPEKYQYRV